MKAFDAELTSGSVFRSVWKLAWPMTLLSLVMGVHGFVDHLLVGHFVPSPANEANAGIGVAWQLFLVLIVFVTSLFHGMNVLVARYAGRRDREALSRIVYQTLYASSLVLFGIFAPLGYMLTPHLLALCAPPEVRVHAQPYMRILFLCGPPLFFMFLLTGALQASGTPKIPLALGVLTTLLNIALSAVFIIWAGLGTAGAALGTCLAPIASVALAAGLIFRDKTLMLRPQGVRLIPDFAVLKTVARIGLPTGVQAVIMNIGGALLLVLIGALDEGAAGQAAYTICYTQLFSFIMWPCFGLRNAAAAAIGQNIGAGATARGKRAVYAAALFGIGWAALLGLIFALFPEHLLALFNAANEPVLSLGASLLRVLALSGFALALMQVFIGGLQGAGDTKSPMFISFVSQIIVLLGIPCIALSMGLLSAQLIWISILISHVTRFLLSFLVFRRERWRRIVVALDSENGAAPQS